MAVRSSPHHQYCDHVPLALMSPHPPNVRRVAQALVHRPTVNRARLLLYVANDCEETFSGTRDAIGPPISSFYSFWVLLGFTWV